MLDLVLFNYYWPPSGGSAVQRWLFLANYLVRNGHNVVVIAPSPEVATYQALDRSLVDRVDPRVRVVHTEVTDYFSLYKRYIGKGKVPTNSLGSEASDSLIKKIARFVRGNFFLPDPRRGWNKHAIQAGRQVLDGLKNPILITAGPPHSTHLIGTHFKQKYETTWVADFHDYWTELFILPQFYRTALAHQLDSYYERNVLKQTDLVLTHCMSSKRIQQKKLQSGHDKLLVHTMGFNPDLVLRENTAREQDHFTITYSGVIAENYQPDVFFEACRSLLNQAPKAPLLLRFVGTVSPYIQGLVEQYELGAYFESTGYVSHQRAVDFLRQSTLLLLVNPHVPSEKRIVPGKLYEYLAVRKPILAISTKGSEVEDILQLTKAGRLFTRTQVSELTTHLLGQLALWRQRKELDLDTPNNLLNNYNRATEAAVLEENLKRLRPTKKS